MSWLLLPSLVAKLMAILYVSLSAALSPKFEGTLARKNELGKLKGFTP